MKTYKKSGSSTPSCGASKPSTAPSGRVKDSGSSKKRSSDDDDDDEGASKPKKKKEVITALSLLWSLALVRISLYDGKIFIPI